MNAHSDIQSRLLRAIDLGANAHSSDFDLNAGTRVKPKQTLRDAAVLVLFVEVAGVWQIVLTKRASALRHHPGQIAFPGGKKDDADASLKAAALREAHEEIGMNPAEVEVLGCLGAHDTVTGFRVTPVLGIAKDGFEPIPEAGEVDEVFNVPLSHLLDPHNTRIEQRTWMGAARNYYVMPYGPFYIWGATARMIVGLRDLWNKAG